MCLGELRLNDDDYTLKNSLTWQIFYRHCEEANEARIAQAWGRLFLHATTAALELLPILSQVVSIIESIWFLCIQTNAAPLQHTPITVSQYYNPHTQFAIDFSCIVNPFHIALTAAQKIDLVNAAREYDTDLDTEYSDLKKQNHPAKNNAKYKNERLLSQWHAQGVAVNIQEALALA